MTNPNDIGFYQPKQTKRNNLFNINSCLALHVMKTRKKTGYIARFAAMHKSVSLDKKEYEFSLSAVDDFKLTLNNSTYKCSKDHTIQFFVFSTYFAVHKTFDDGYPAINYKTIVPGDYYNILGKPFEKRENEPPKLDKKGNPYPRTLFLALKTCELNLQADCLPPEVMHDLRVQEEKNQASFMKEVKNEFKKDESKLPF